MLTPEQLSFFKTQGYLLVPGAMDTSLCAQVRDLMWDALPDDVQLSPDDATGPFRAQDTAADPLHFRHDYRWLNRLLGVSEQVIDLVYSREIVDMAQQLLGGELRQATPNGTPMGSQGSAWPGGPTDPALGNEGARGVYCTLPYGDRAREADACHTDGHPFQLGVVGLLHDTPADGGAFKVWPGSHQRLYPTFSLRYDQPRIPYYDHLPNFKGIVHTPEYLQEIEQLNKQSPVECWGQAGDIVFWHHRTAHMAGHNYSNVIRQAVLADFWRLDLDQMRASAPGGDPWRDWSGALQNTAVNAYSPAFAQSQRLPLD